MKIKILTVSSMVTAFFASSLFANEPHSRSSVTVQYVNCGNPMTTLFSCDQNYDPYYYPAYCRVIERYVLDLQRDEINALLNQVRNCVDENYMEPFYQANSMNSELDLVRVTSLGFSSVASVITWKVISSFGSGGWRQRSCLACPMVTMATASTIAWLFTWASFYSSFFTPEQIDALHDSTVDRLDSLEHLLSLMEQRSRELES